MHATAHTLRIRPYQKSDAAITLAIFLAAITTTAARDYTAEQLHAWARPEQRDLERWHHDMTQRRSFVATVNGEVAGFSDVAPDGYIDMIFVAPEHQGQGVARRLLQTAESQAKEHGAKELWADVSITARPFFESQGFRVQREQHPIRQGVRLVNFRMHKPLS